MKYIGTKLSSETQTPPSSGWGQSIVRQIAKFVREEQRPGVTLAERLAAAIESRFLPVEDAQRDADASQIAALQESEQAVIESARAWAERAEAAEARVSAFSAQVEQLQAERPNLLRNIFEQSRANDELREQVARLTQALTESVKLQAHYAELLNMHDGGKRTVFTSIEQWLQRVTEIKARAGQ